MFSRYFAASCGRGLLLLSLAAVCSLALVAGDASEGAEGSTSISLPASTRPSGNGRDSSHGTTVEYKLATLNVRLAKPLKQNPLPPLNYSWEPAWRYRRAPLIAHVLGQSPDVIGFQEVLHRQLQDLVGGMGDEYAYVSAGRSDARPAKQQLTNLVIGQAVPIFWRKDRFEVISVTHFWLSNTPFVPGSKGWDAAHPRVSTLLHLRESRGNATQDLWVLNTHFDNSGSVARVNSARLIVEGLKPLVANGTSMGTDAPSTSKLPAPMFLLGDLNCQREDAAYEILTGGRYFDKDEASENESARMAPSNDQTSPEGQPADAAYPAGTFIDTHRESAAKDPDGTGSVEQQGTFTSFRRNSKNQTIDFIMMAGGGPESWDDSPGYGTAERGHRPTWEVVNTTVESNIVGDGTVEAFRLSDHRMLTTTVRRHSG